MRALEADRTTVPIWALEVEIQMAIPEFSRSSKWMTQSSKIKKVLIGLTRANPIDRLDAAEALSLLTDGVHPLISSGSAGSDWVLEKKSQRPQCQI
jgi:hypothetical protein